MRRKDPVAIREGFKRVEQWTKHIDLFNKARLLQKAHTPVTIARKPATAAAR